MWIAFFAHFSVFLVGGAVFGKVGISGALQRISQALNAFGVNSHRGERKPRFGGDFLYECRKLGIDRVLMVCDSDNVASAKTIIRNGGVMENEVEVDGIVEQRYWIDLGEKI